MNRLIIGGAAALMALGALTTTAVVAKETSKTTFFVTSIGPGKGGDLGGLAGADAWCQKLATQAGIGDHAWRAYLSATDAKGKAIHARDRIGKGPWFNAKGLQIASSVDDLHSEGALTSKANSLDETGNPIKGRGESPNQHDIMTGSLADGRLAPPVASPLPANAPAGTPAPVAPPNLTCNNWTSSSESRTMVGHHDRIGGGQNPTSWNAAHQTRSCSQPDLVATGGAGFFYCFAAK